MEIAPNAATLFLARVDDPLARVPDLGCESKRVERRRDLANEEVDEREVGGVGLVRGTSADEESAEAAGPDGEGRARGRARATRGRSLRPVGEAAPPVRWPRRLRRLPRRARVLAPVTRLAARRRGRVRCSPARSHSRDPGGRREAVDSTAHARPKGTARVTTTNAPAIAPSDDPIVELGDEEDREEHDQTCASDPGNDERPPQHQIHLDRPVPEHRDGRCDGEHRDRRRQRRRVHRTAGFEHEREREVEREQASGPDGESHSRPRQRTRTAMHATIPATTARGTQKPKTPRTSTHRHDSGIVSGSMVVGIRQLPRDRGCRQGRSHSSRPGQRCERPPATRRQLRRSERAAMAR